MDQDRERGYYVRIPEPAFRALVHLAPPRKGKPTPLDLARLLILEGIFRRVREPTAEPDCRSRMPR